MGGKGERVTTLMRTYVEGLFIQELPDISHNRPPTLGPFIQEMPEMSHNSPHSHGPFITGGAPKFTSNKPYPLGRANLNVSELGWVGEDW